MSEITVHTQLRRNALGVAGIVFLVLAAVAPLTGIVVVASLVIALGNGGGAPVSFFIVAAVLLLFAVGYAQMSKQLVSAGGFYAFVVMGLAAPADLSPASSRHSATTSSWWAPLARAASSCRS